MKNGKHNTGLGWFEAKLFDNRVLGNAPAGSCWTHIFTKAFMSTCVELAQRTITSGNASWISRTIVSWITTPKCVKCFRFGSSSNFQITINTYFYEVFSKVPSKLFFLKCNLSGLCHYCGPRSVRSVENGSSTVLLRNSSLARRTANMWNIQWYGFFFFHYLISII